MDPKRVVVIGIEPVFKDAAGCIREWKIDNGCQITVIEKLAGAVGEGHVHDGKDPSKNPERLLIVKGDIELVFWECGQNVKYSQRVGVGDPIIIQPGVAHVLHFLTDSIVLEFRITHFDKNNPDTVKVKEPV